jgi:hypothetical protein
MVFPPSSLAGFCGFVAAVGRAYEVYDWVVSRIPSDFVDPGPADRSAALEVVLREYPEEDEEDEEEDDQDGEDDGNSDGYSE